MTDLDSMKRVIVNADDFGFSRGVTEGILRAHRDGILTSTTIMANMPDAEAAAKRLSEAPGLGVGVHLNVAQGPALSKEGARLAGAEGVMNRTAFAVVRATFLKGMLAAIEAECDAQIRWALDHGIRPTHLDSHRHVHVFPAIFVRVVSLAMRYHIRYVRWPVERLPGGGWPGGASRSRMRSWLVNRCCGMDARNAGALRGTQGTWGISHAGHIDAEWLKLAASRVPPGVTEIMTHPGLAVGLDAKLTRMRESRQVEMDALCDPEVKEAFNANGVKLIHYGNLE